MEYCPNCNSTKLMACEEGNDCEPYELFQDFNGIWMHYNGVDAEHPQGDSIQCLDCKSYFHYTEIFKE